MDLEENIIIKNKLIEYEIICAYLIELFHLIFYLIEIYIFF